MINKVLPDRWKIPEVEFGKAAEERMAKRRAEYESEDAAEKVDIVEEHIDESGGEPQTEFMGPPEPPTDGADTGGQSADNADGQKQPAIVTGGSSSNQNIDAKSIITDNSSTQNINIADNNSLSDGNGNI